MMQRSDGSTASTSWQLCACGRTFAQPNASSKHKRTCPQTRKRLSSALDSAKERWTGNKRFKASRADLPSESVAHPLMPGLMRAPSTTHDTDLELVCILFFDIGDN